MTLRTWTRKRFCIESAFALLAIAVICAVALPPMFAFAHGRGETKHHISGSRARVLAMATMQYEADHGRPLDPSGWLDTLQEGGYLEASDRFSNSKNAIGQDHYFFVPLGTIDVRTQTVTDVRVYEHPDLFAVGGNIVTDGLTNRFHTQASFDAIINALRNPDGTPFAPHKD